MGTGKRGYKPEREDPGGIGSWQGKCFLFHHIKKLKMFVAISFEVQNGMEAQVMDAFRNRPQLVENFAGFERLEVL